MDDRSSRTAVEGVGGPVLVGANWFRFRPGQEIRYACVDSVCFLWALRGAGRITSCGLELRVEAGSVLRLPWGHDVQYRADDRAPFHVGTLHLVPWHAADVPVEPRVPHVPDDPLFDVTWRRGPAQDHPPWQVPDSTPVVRNFVTLATYCVDRFVSQPFDDAVARALGVLVSRESARWELPEGSRDWPGALEAMVAYVESHIGVPLSVEAVAAAGGCSSTTAQRLFGKHTGQSVLGWVRARKLRQASVLLRTTGMRVNEVARAVGFDDALYFSRVFRAGFGASPTEFSGRQIRP